MPKVTVKEVAPRVEPVYEYTITFNKKDAEALLEICQFIGGNAAGPRGVFSDGANSLDEQLRAAGVQRNRNIRADGAVRFAVNGF